MSATQFHQIFWSVDNEHEPKLNGVLLSAGYNVDMQNCAVNVSLFEHTVVSLSSSSVITRGVEAPPHGKAKARHHGEDLSYCKVSVVPSKQELWSFLVWPHGCLLRSWSKEKSKLSFAGRLVCELQRRSLTEQTSVVRALLA